MLLLPLMRLSLLFLNSMSPPHARWLFLHATAIMAATARAVKRAMRRLIFIAFTRRPRRPLRFATSQAITAMPRKSERAVNLFNGSP